MKAKDKVIVVTGGGGGLGRSLVLNLIGKGANVAAIDIDAVALGETQKLAAPNTGQLSTHVLDITDRNKVMAFPEEVIKTHGAIDGLINNAGVIQPFVPVNELEIGAMQRIMDINFYGTLYMVKAFLPHFLKRPEAHVVNVSSLGGFMPFPGQTIYGASKAAVKLLTEGLYAELKDTQVRATVIHPGAIKTNIMANSGLENSISMDDDEKAENSAALLPEKAAEQIIKAMENNKYRATVGRDSRMLDMLYRFSPRTATDLIVKKMKDIAVPNTK